MNPFKKYDIRGIYPYELNEEFAFSLGGAVVSFLKGKKLVIGRDGRTSSNSLFSSLVEGIISCGCDVIDIGRCSTPQFYFEIYNGTADGGIMITASHNSKEFNGFKICGPNAKPIFEDNGFDKIKKLMDEDLKSNEKGHVLVKNFFNEYVKYFSKFKKNITKKMRILVDCGNGMGITEVKALDKLYPNIQFETIFPIIDGSFPNHECNPVKKENLRKLLEEIRIKKYDLGFALDGDSDRVVCVTSSGFVIPSDILIAILANEVCVEGDKVGYEVRTGTSVVEEIQKKFVPKIYPSGHALIKQGMIKDNCVFAGEKSGHYFYQKFHYCESVLYTMMLLMTIEDLDKKAKEIISRKYSLEEKNYVVKDKNGVLSLIEKEFSSNKILKIDGLSVYGKSFFFNIRKSNTEDLVRLNIEGDSKKIVDLVLEKIEKIIS